MIEELVEVACYAGSRYPQRPLRVTWRGGEHEVMAMELNRAQQLFEQKYN